MSANLHPVPVTRVRGNRVEPRLQRLRTVEAARQARGLLSDSRLKADFEASAGLTGPVVPSKHVNLLVAAADTAFNEHLPLRLSPDAVWTTLLQGLGHHVRQDAEALRSCFVAHPGKKSVDVRRDEFRRGAPDNDWPGMVTELAGKTREHVLDGARAALTARFSTTDDLAAVVADLAVCSAVQEFFNFSLWTMCGIPEFLIEGTAADWTQLRDRVAKWADWDLEWWTRGACEVLGQCVAAVEGRPDESFWQSFYHHDGASGGAHLTGEMAKLFPYVHGEGMAVVRNRGLRVAPGSYPSSVSQVPFTWHYLEQAFPYQLVGGMMGVEQLEDYSVRPRLGWVVGPAAAAGESVGNEGEAMMRFLGYADREDFEARVAEGSSD
ncbi:MAG: DUF4419 domain-containing protein [Deltaproteobacteria bacterium]|nr:DUF4419 domain-containing protein [Deltaproteobacteria bacterium]